MSEHECKKDELFQDLEFRLTQQSQEFNEGFYAMSSKVDTLVAEQRTFIRELRDFAVEDREHKINIDNIKEGLTAVNARVTAAKNRILHFEDNVHPSMRSDINALSTKVNGAFMAGKLIPSICTVISVAVAVYVAVLQ